MALVLPCLLAAFAVRAAVALWGDFVLHPDEIMQYLEPAHYAAFGNGVLYWEYIHGARSWLIPGAVAGVLKALDAIGLAQPAVYIAVVKLLFCLLSLLIPWAMYRFTRITVNEQAARVALLFGCFWYELVALAHKPFTEFVSAAVLMTALALSVGARNANARIPYLNALYLQPPVFQYVLRRPAGGPQRRDSSPIRAAGTGTAAVALGAAARRRAGVVMGGRAAGHGTGRHPRMANLGRAVPFLSDQFLFQYRARRNAHRRVKPLASARTTWRRPAAVVR